MSVLVTGAGGYIGSHVCKLLKKSGYTVVANDIEFVEHEHWHSDLNDMNYDTISRWLIQNLCVDTLVHIGATSLVGPSVTDPARYYHNNIASSLKLLDDCLKAGVRKVVFASSAACYGEPTETVCREDMPHQPCNPYGWSKRMMEIILKDYYHAYNMSSVCLRFFNVAGADSDGELGQAPGGSHIIAKAIERTLAGKKFTLFGNNYNTPDGTCVRDYVHVEDIALGVLNSIELLNTQPGSHIFNLGGKRGYSNLEIIETINSVTPLRVDLEYGDPRPGDPSTLVADTTRANTVLNWHPTHSLESIIKSAYQWYIKDV